MFDSLLLALGAGLAVALELLEAAAIVLAVGLSRRWSDALIGASAAILVLHTTITCASGVVSKWWAATCRQPATSRSCAEV